MYKKAAIAQLYYSTDNQAIGQRLGYLERQTQMKANVVFHRLRNGFFAKAVKKFVLYLMGNGVTLDDKIKLKIDKQFDRNIIMATINACVDGVVWGFVDIDKLVFFRATEFAPLFDERTSQLMAGIRFWQASADKPIYVELYEIDGVTEYKISDRKVELIGNVRPYKQTVRKDSLTTTVINEENYGMLPVFSLYANELKTSELNTGLKESIDAYDFALSDLFDAITKEEGIYKTIKNFGGNDAKELVEVIQRYRTIEVEGDGGVDFSTLEAPFQAKAAALDRVEEQMYSNFGLPNSKTDRGAVTAREIVERTTDLDIKADLLEWEVAKFIEQVLEVKGINTKIENFKRRTASNDTETINNIATELSNGWIDQEMAIMLDPSIPEEHKEDLMARLALADIGVPEEATAMIEESD